jgi:trehalose monomycolate/heme transporter
MFIGMGRFVVRHRRAVLVAAALLTVVGGIWGSGVFGALGIGGYGAAAAEAVRATELLERELGHEGTDAVAVYRSDDGRTVDDPAFAAAVRTALDALPREHTAEVVHYWAPDVPDVVRGTLVSFDRTATYATLTMNGADEDERLAAYAAIVDDLHVDGLHTALGGGLPSMHQLHELASEDLVRAELIALPVLFLLLVIVFRGVVAAALPVLLGVLAIIGAMVLMRLLAMVTDISIFAFNIATMLGLGLAIDYGLFIVSRFRDELARFGDATAAVYRTMATAGRTVGFSAATVMIAFCALLLFPQPYIRSIGLGGISAVVFDLLAALTVLPALLAVLGRRIDALALPGMRRRPVAGSGAWSRFAGTVMRRPVRWLVAAGAVLLVMGAPLLALQPGITNHRYLPIDAGGQVSLAAVRDAFPADGPGTSVANGMDVAVVGAVSRPDLDAYVARLAALDGAFGVEVRRSGPGLAHVNVGFRGEADSAVNVQLVREVRAQAPPAGAAEVLVGGSGTPAQHLDNVDAVLATVPWAALAVVAANLVLLFLAFGSIVLPVKAVLVTFVSLAASVGALVWGVQDGGLAPLLGFVPVGSTDVGNLMLVIVIVFGLATDYELFLISRIREEYLATGQNAPAVAAGMQRTGQIITSAALLLVVVVGAMGFTSRSLVLTTIGLGLTVAIVVDATLVRSVLVPATMRLLGNTNWWLPAPLRRLHDRIGLSEREQAADSRVAGGAPALQRG